MKTSDTAKPFRLKLNSASAPLAMGRVIEKEIAKDANAVDGEILDPEGTRQAEFVYTKEEMDRLESLVAKVVGAHGANHPELLTMRDLLQQLFGELRVHMFKEEQILFPKAMALEATLSLGRD